MSKLHMEICWLESKYETSLANRQKAEVYWVKQYMRQGQMYRYGYDK